ncbi:MAG: S9 family peptidase [Verrucomicrobiales bacterium]|nr:S9 family peptidase [Verrucomicrobiales bacterium]
MNGVRVGFAMLLAWMGSPTAIRAAAPPTPHVAVTNEYFGRRVVDPFQWLEEAENPRVMEWTKLQNQHTRRYLDRLPSRARLERRLAALHARSGSTYSGVKPAGTLLLARKAQPPKEQPVLVILDSTASPSSERVLLDPAVLDPSGGTSIESFFPSPDGSRIAVVLAQGGSEQGSLQVFETATGRPLDERIPRVAFPTAGSSLAWEPDGGGFHYTRYPLPGERADADLAFYVQVYHHRLGTAWASDRHVLGREFPRIGEVFLDQRTDGRYLRVTVQLGDGGDFAHWLRGPDGSWQRLADYAEGVKAVVFGPDDWLYLFSKKDAPKGRLLRLKLPDLDVSHAQVVVPPSEAVIEGFGWRGLEIVPNFVVTRSAVVVVDILGGPSQVRVFDLDGSRPRTVALPAVSAVDSITATPDGSVLLRATTYTSPPGWFRLHPADARLERTPLMDAAAVTFDDVEVIRESATSKDGTKVPLNIIHRKGLKRDGSHPVLLTGYGGYGVNIAPEFLGIDGRVWLDAGGIWAVANLRGGGEFGEAWHQGGRLTKKQNVFDDFIACATNLVQRRYTTPKRLAIEGGSNGGLLMGAVLTQRPSLFRAVVAHVGIHDMLRVERDANGAFNVPEFGTVTDAVQFNALHLYSPYHQVVDGTRYPAVFLLTGANDGRVNPYHSRKMTARLQEATRSDSPVLLRVSGTSGHGMGTALSESIAQRADAFAFLFDQLEMRAR